jgi:hypothetical protein
MLRFCRLPNARLQSDVLDCANARGGDSVLTRLVGAGQQAVKLIRRPGPLRGFYRELSQARPGMLRMRKSRLAIRPYTGGLLCQWNCTRPALQIKHEMSQTSTSRIWFEMLCELVYLSCSGEWPVSANTRCKRGDSPWTSAKPCIAGVQLKERWRLGTRQILTCRGWTGQISRQWLGVIVARLRTVDCFGVGSCSPFRAFHNNPSSIMSMWDCLQRETRGFQRIHSRRVRGVDSGQRKARVQVAPAPPHPARPTQARRRLVVNDQKLAPNTYLREGPDTL